MKRSVLGTDFYTRPALMVARDLLGMYLGMRKNNGTVIFRMITEVEAYDSFYDKASHASRGKTERNAPMFEKGGIWYVYLIYGMYDMLNIVTGTAGYPAAVLIRGIAGVDGPGKLTKQLGITRTYNGLSAVQGTGLWIEDRGLIIPKTRIKKAPRVGVKYAGPVWAQKKYRFFISSI